jgi:integrase
MPSHASITEPAARKFTVPASGQVDHFDKQYPGLALRVSCGGRRSWTYTYRIGGKQKRMTLGLFPAELTVAQAHDAWRKARDSVRTGRDPSLAPSKDDFRHVFEEWMKRDQCDNRSTADTRRKFEKNILPHWQHRPIASIGRRDLLDVINAIADRGAIIQARRIQSRLHRLFAWAVGYGYIETNPVTGLPKPGSEKSRDRVLTDDELLKVWQGAERLGYPYGPAVQLLILTGARRDEIASLRWSEIIGDTISLSGDRTKNGQAHIIPLSAPARDILNRLPRVVNRDFVFSNGMRPISCWPRATKELPKFANHWTIHDLRRTLATGLQRLGVPLQVTEAVLNHTGSRAGIVGIYQRHDYAQEKRSALDAWGAHVASLVGAH